MIGLLAGAALTDAIVIVIIALIIGLATLYIIKAKKSGQKCIGCPHSKTCGSNKTVVKRSSCEKSEGCCCCNKSACSSCEEDE